MKKNFKIIIEYDGTNYHGWQRQTKEPTIQGEIEKALMTMTKKNLTLIGSGRTDAGVHAFGQVANFVCDTTLDPDVFQKGLNSLLPKDIVIKRCVRVPIKFHARYDAKSKTYRYRLLDDGYINFEIKGDGFLRFMVRNIVGTLVDVGLEKITPDDFHRILKSKDRNDAGVTAPAQGLFLVQVAYSDE